MAETLLLTLVCFGFVVVSLGLAINFAVNAYLDWQEQQVAIEQGIRLVNKRNAEEAGEEYDDSLD